MKSGFRSSVFRILRVTLIMLALIGAATWLRRMLTSIESEQAVINAEIIQIRTPIKGQLAIGEVRQGMVLKKGAPLFKVVDVRFGDRETVAQYNALQTLVDALNAELFGAKHQLELAQIARDRAVRLYNTGVIARAAKELDETKFEMAEKLVQAKTEQLDRAEARTKEMGEQMAMQKQSVATMPADGLIWSIAGKTGEEVNTNTLVMEVLNPANIWVEAFFAERHARELKPGLPAHIRSLDSAAAWRGRLQSIRAGVGRLAYDTTVAVPPPEMAKRQIAVRVEAEWEKPFSATEFYGVGRSVQVTFSKRKAERTVGDVLKEKFDRVISKPRRDSTTTAR